MHLSAAVIERPTDLRADWLTEALGDGEVADFAVERIGTGQMSECYRVALRYAAGAGPDTVVLKVAASHPASRGTGLAMGLYEREVRFYTDVAPRCAQARTASVPLAPCYAAGYDPSTGAFHLVLGDAAPAVVGDEIRGATLEQATLAVSQLALLQGPLLGSAALADAAWLSRESPLDQALVASLWEGFADRYADRIAAEHRIVCERLVAGFDSYLAAEAAPDRPAGLVHGDYRLDNMLFGQAGADRRLTVVDWQTVTWGPAFTDLAYFLGCALPVAARREHYDGLLRAYLAGLGPDAPVTLEDVRVGVRGQSFFGVMMAMVSSMLVARTERGDELFMTMLHRHCEHVLDTGALSELGAPPAAPVGEAPQRPADADEGAHVPTGEPLWNESWYLDFADPAQGVGGYVRLGVSPHEQAAWLTAELCGPGRPTVALVDYEVPLPPDAFAVRTDTATLRHGAVVPLRTYSVSLSGDALAYDDPADVLRGAPGRPARLEFDLQWTTAGEPYQYRIASRYEIPCTVTGTVTVDGQRFAVTEVAGQRDHSWGVRDWWSMDWVWHAFHLDDGTHLHGVDLRLPGGLNVGVGYRQRDGALTELDRVVARETYGDNGLPLSTTLILNPGALEVDVDIRGHGPLRLEAPDGRVAHFSRAWATVSTGDGRTGAGWIEWNRNAAP
ncbi:ecdysteroid 22-kinase family protein [Mycobacterium sp. MYCO198283]|uniref:ecdysteroid 22-kinase family protein n=1 Tax=Mycobacterium sp. MYCO198283 TaxID=2883505 RepID=UPI001E4E1F83|nr:ecdysteroid 22-kinase family protein [Mycobacterium sp. MYCO198283]MCG5433371.1 ecdysteroid 22-kinase family protein [Mycobacterium sp. MYCO198283]